VLGSEGEPERRVVRANGEDRATLLANWLEELIFLAETAGFSPGRLLSIELGLAEVSASVAGFRGDPPPLVKAITYHRLEFRREDGKWRARVVLDV
jgi:SHS2 domain-containing protein